MACMVMARRRGHRRARTRRSGHARRRSNRAVGRTGPAASGKGAPSPETRSASPTDGISDGTSVARVWARRCSK